MAHLKRNTVNPPILQRSIWKKKEMEKNTPRRQTHIFSIFVRETIWSEYYFLGVSEVNASVNGNSYLLWSLIASSSWHKD